MKFVVFAGGVAGFALGAVTSWACDHAPDRVFLDAAVGCLAGALLLRWFWTLLVRGFRETLQARHDAAIAAAAAARADTKTK